jgi:hypothetical protein
MLRLGTGTLLAIDWGGLSTVDVDMPVYDSFPTVFTDQFEPSVEVSNCQS